MGEKSRVYYKDFTFLLYMKMKERFLNYIAYTVCLSKLTVLKYRKALDKFDSFLKLRWKTVDDPENIAIEDVSDFIADMIELWLSPVYCNSISTWIKSYLNYLRDILGLTVLESRRIKYCKTPDKNIWYYSERQKYQILDMVDKGFWVKDITKLRNKLLTYMFLLTWLRCHELAKIKVNEIWESLQIVGKWWKRRTVYLRKELLDMIGEYLSKREKESEYLFPCHNKWEWHIHKSSIRWIFYQMTNQLWFKIHPHKFRHTFATDLLHIPWSNIYNVAKLLGHNSISTTQIYLWTNDVELKNLQFSLKI